MSRWATSLVAALAVACCVTSPVQAAETDLTISHVEPGDGNLQLLVSVPEGADVALDELQVEIDGQPSAATAELAAESDEIVKRTTILAIDTSNSMSKRGRFEAAQLAASTFFETVPDDVLVGIVTFDSDVETVLEPTVDREAAAAVVDGLTLALETRLNDGVIQAVDLAGDDGQRTVLVLSDGRDTSATPESDVIDAITAADVTVDVVALDQGGSALEPLEQMAGAGAGSVIPADPASLSAAFEREASSLARQLQVSAAIPAGVEAAEATIRVSVPVAGELLTASTFAVIQGGGPSIPPLEPVVDGTLQIPQTVMYGGIAALGVGLMLLVGALVWGVGQPATVEARIAAYGANPVHPAAGADGTGGNLGQAKDAAASVLRHNRDLETRIATRLEAAGSELKPAEWLLLHAAIATVSALTGMLLGEGSLVHLLLFLAAGLVLPWLWLGRKRRKRVKAFNAGMADTLQLISGSLSAGMSLAQSLDTVVREGSEPIAGEFKRVLVETRLGVSIEDALDGIAVRMDSKDFSWVVMAIRIQREVGGNLAELLNSVAGTLRERDYLRRQVQTLSAEGKLSGYILGGLPPGMMVYMLTVRPTYIAPIFSEVLGWIMLGAAAFLLALGAFAMSRIVKVEV